MTKSSTDSPSLPCPSTSGSAKVDLLCAPVNDAVLPSSTLSAASRCPRRSPAIALLALEKLRRTRAP
eukprot:CAMPEP_0179455590 /NCGR_PEP_ID=MMETSP0799-20121207/39514_1 /TAXON_ID=46947 /ORGANISM="Geminigera cryophila, Strain CCMP2564" /LENGTH=66 /DNA_ID=CAMNT_0021254741 /DNA_START=967 /DNA_END=1164 /DNA_ORIENTATION=-